MCFFVWNPYPKTFLFQEEKPKEPVESSKDDLSKKKQQRRRRNTRPTNSYMQVKIFPFFF